MFEPFQDAAPVNEILKYRPLIHRQYKGAVKSLARPGRKQANVSVRIV